MTIDFESNDVESSMIVKQSHEVEFDDEIDFAIKHDLKHQESMISKKSRLQCLKLFETSSFSKFSWFCIKIWWSKKNLRMSSISKSSAHEKSAIVVVTLVISICDLSTLRREVESLCVDRSKFSLCKTLSDRLHALSNDFDKTLNDANRTKRTLHCIALREFRSKLYDRDFVLHDITKLIMHR